MAYVTLPEFCRFTGQTSSHSPFADFYDISLFEYNQELCADVPFFRTCPTSPVYRPTQLPARIEFHRHLHRMCPLVTRSSILASECSRMALEL
jgi:hypothetical protein